MSRVSPGRPRSSARLAATAPASDKPRSFPGFIAPALATLRSTVPQGAHYVHELKLDGYRVQAHVLDGRATLYTRSGHDWTRRFAPIAEEVARLSASALVLDGEIISAGEDGRPDFAALQDDLRSGRKDRLVYYVFDLLHLDGRDMRSAPLVERKRALQSLLAKETTATTRVLYSEHFEDGPALHAHARALGLEGIVSKRADAPYRSGRGDTWLKTKCLRHERFVVVGFAPEGSTGVLKLRLARREDDALIYVGRVGTGWDRKTAAAIRRALQPLARPKSALAKPIKRADTIWIEPHYEAGVVYVEITSDGMICHPAFKGLALAPERLPSGNG